MCIHEALWLDLSALEATASTRMAWQCSVCLVSLSAIEKFSSHVVTLFMKEINLEKLLVCACVCWGGVGGSSVWCVCSWDIFTCHFAPYLGGISGSIDYKES